MHGCLQPPCKPAGPPCPPSSLSLGPSPCPAPGVQRCAPESLKRSPQTWRSCCARSSCCRCSCEAPPAAAQPGAAACAAAWQPPNCSASPPWCVQAVILAPGSPGVVVEPAAAASGGGGARVALRAHLPPVCGHARRRPAHWSALLRSGHCTVSPGCWLCWSSAGDGWHRLRPARCLLPCSCAPQRRLRLPHC